MGLFELEAAPARSVHVAVSTAEIDEALTAQLVVAWAGESGEDKRLGWWRCDLVSEFGGEDLFRRLLPITWAWAVLEGSREAARRTDAELRRQDHDPDRIFSLFRFGFDLDERIDERLRDLKQSVVEPEQALPGLADGGLRWNRERFLDWVRGHGSSDVLAAPIGRRIQGEPSATLGDRVRLLVGGLAPLTERYPLPHFQRVT